MARRVFLYAMHRSGSTELLHVAGDICKAKGFAHFSHNKNTPLRLTQGTFDLADLPEEGPVCAGPVRFPWVVEFGTDDRALMMLRDPRDVLVSMFFSYCFSHSGEAPGDAEFRRAVAASGIDDFVLKMAFAKDRPYRGDFGTGLRFWDQFGNVVTRYKRFLEIYLANKACTLLRYETLVEDFEKWLKELADAFGGLTPKEQAQIVARHNRRSRPNPENPKVHRRQMWPGDHRSKLKPQTIAQLDEGFAFVLTTLGAA